MNFKKPAVTQLVRKLSPFYETYTYITVCCRANRVGDGGGVVIVVVVVVVVVVRATVRLWQIKIHRHIMLRLQLKRVKPIKSPILK